MLAIVSLIAMVQAYAVLQTEKRALTDCLAADRFLTSAPATEPAIASFVNDAANGRLLALEG